MNTKARSVVLSLFAVLALTTTADACNRCGLFGRRCRVSHVSRHVAVAPLVVRQPDVFVVQQNNPAPIAAYGTTVAAYGTGQYSAFTAQPFDSAAFLAQAAQLTQGAQELARLGHETHGQAGELALTLQQRNQELAIRTAGAAELLRAAGLDPQYNTQQETTVLQIRRGGSGAPELKILSAEEIQQLQLRMQQGDNPASPPEQPTTDTQPAGGLFASQCAACHGGPNPSAKYADGTPVGLILDGSAPLDYATLGKVTAAVAQDRMPPPGSGGPLPAAQKGALLDEAIRLVQ